MWAKLLAKEVALRSTPFARPFVLSLLFIMIFQEGDGHFPLLNSPSSSTNKRWLTDVLPRGYTYKHTNKELAYRTINNRIYIIDRNKMGIIYYA
jgi:hypothetical protein